MATDSKHFETLALHGGPYRADPVSGAVAVPIYQTTSYQFQSAEHAAIGAGHPGSEISHHTSSFLAARSCTAVRITATTRIAP